MSQTILDVLKTAKTLTNDGLTEKVNIDGKLKAKDISGLFDKPLAGKNSAALTVGASEEIINERVQPNRTLIMVGMLGKGLDDCLITIYGEDDAPIITNIFGDVLNDQRIFPFTCPHIVKPGSTYKAVIKYDGATGTDLDAKTGKLVILGVKLSWV